MQRLSYVSAAFLDLWYLTVFFFIFLGLLVYWSIQGVTKFFTVRSAKQ